MCRCRLGQGQLSDAEEECEDREVDSGRDEWRNPDGYAQAECEVEDVVKGDMKVRPTTTPMITVTA